MFLRLEKLLCELPEASEPDPVAAQVVQELMGGRFGEMSDPHELHLPGLQLPGQEGRQTVLRSGGQYHGRGNGPCGTGRQYDQRTLAGCGSSR